MIEPKIGDFIVNKEGIWEITDIYKNGPSKLYDIECISDTGDFLESQDISNTYKKIGVSLSHLKHLGMLIEKENHEKAVEILFKLS